MYIIILSFMYTCIHFYFVEQSQKENILVSHSKYTSRQSTGIAAMLELLCWQNSTN
jgi:hypothetical protein